MGLVLALYVACTDQGLLRLSGAQGCEPPQESPEDCEPEGAVLVIDVVV